MKKLKLNVLIKKLKKKEELLEGFIFKILQFSFSVNFIIIHCILSLKILFQRYYSGFSCYKDKVF